MILLAQHTKLEIPCLFGNAISALFTTSTCFTEEHFKVTPSEICRLSMQNSEISESSKELYKSCVCVFLESL